MNLLICFLKHYIWFENEISAETITDGEEISADLSHSCDHQEVMNKQKKKKKIKTLTTNNILTRLPVLFTQITAADSSSELKTKSDKYQIFCINAKTSEENFTKK